MDMETRKTIWANRIADQIGKRPMTKAISMIVSICQDAFNEGHKAGEASTLNQVSPYLKGETPNDR